MVMSGWIRCLSEFTRQHLVFGRSMRKTSTEFSIGNPIVRTSTSMARPGAVIEKEGDLFDAPRTTSLAHCVSTDMKMGAGIAVLFRNKFGQVEKLKRQQKSVGEVAFLMDGERYIFYLVTKQWYFNKPTESTLECCLYEMKDLCEKYGVKELAMPRIGCGLDKLKWPRIFQMIEEVFSGSGMNITIYTIPEKKSIPNLTKSQERFRNIFDQQKPQSSPVSDKISKRKLHSHCFEHQSGMVKERKRMRWDTHEVATSRKSHHRGHSSSLHHEADDGCKMDHTKSFPQNEKERKYRDPGSPEAMRDMRKKSRDHKKTKEIKSKKSSSKLKKSQSSKSRKKMSSRRYKKVKQESEGLLTVKGGRKY